MQLEFSSRLDRTACRRQTDTRARMDKRTNTHTRQNLYILTVWAVIKRMSKACSPVVGSSVPVVAVPGVTLVVLPGTEVVTVTLAVVVAFWSAVVVTVVSCVVVELPDIVVVTAEWVVGVAVTVVSFSSTVLADECSTYTKCKDT